MRGLLYSEEYRPLFSGHETFALRQLWLKKAMDIAMLDRSRDPLYSDKKNGIDRPAKKNVFSADAAIVTLGVGKNMVNSIKHWASACDVLSDVNGTPTPTAFGLKIFGNDGLDPYSEHSATMWLVHWKLAGGWRIPENRTHRSTTWFWVFNHIHEQTFNVKGLLKQLEEYARHRSGEISPVTLKRDVEVCLRCYVDRSETTSIDDCADSMLSELGLVTVQSSDEFALRRGPKGTLTDGAFLYALLEFWEAYGPGQSTLSFETIAYEIGSPGRVFKMDEDSVAARLINLESLTKGQYQWSDSAGQRQIIRMKPMPLNRALELAYG